ncbi:10250_t:CDS:10, partial [Acaulospora morrowiae]
DTQIMPKKSQHKRKLQQEDFKKPKLKVGKKKPKAANFTDTSFKSRSIILPSQSISEDKSNEITNSRNLTLNDLVVQLKHYSPGTRKDAIQGLKDFFYRYPNTLSESLSTIVNSLARLLIDNDRNVRKTLLSFFAEFFPNVPKSDIRPFLPLLIVYTCSAMTHIYEDIRIDAIKFVEIWLSVAPDIVVDGFWRKIIQNYISLLSSESNFSNTSVKGSVSGITGLSVNAHTRFLSNEIKFEILSSFHKILKFGLTKGDEENSHWFFLDLSPSDRLGNQTTKPIYRSNQGVLNDWSKFHGEMGPPPLHSLSATLLPFLSLPDVEHNYKQLNLFNSVSSTEVNKSFINIGNEDEDSRDNLADRDVSTLQGRTAATKELLNTLHPILLSVWLETVPSVFDSSTAFLHMQPELQLIHTALKMITLLWRSYVHNVFKNKSANDGQLIEATLKQLLRYFVIHFPFGSRSEGIQDLKVESILQEMNIMFCEMVILYLILTNLNPPPGKAELKLNSKKLTLAHARKKRKRDDDSETIKSDNFWIDQVFDYVIEFLGSEQSKNNMMRISMHTKPEHLTAMLPTIWGLLNCADQERQEIIFEAILDYSRRCHAQSIAKRKCIDFISRGLMLQSFSNRKDSSLVASLQTWALSLPKLLWELKTNSLETTEDILGVLCDFAKRGDKCMFDNEIWDQLQTSLIPFFYVELPHKGPLYGPFISLPENLQRKTIEFLYYCPRITDKMRSSLNQVFRREEVESVKIYVKDLSEKF